MGVTLNLAPPQVLWTAVSQVLIGEIVRLRMIWTSTSLLADQAAAGANQQQHIEAGHDGLIAALQRLLTAMTNFAHTSPLMGESLCLRAYTIY